MKNKLSFIFIGFCFYTWTVSAQEAKQIFLGIEVGMTAISCTMAEMDYVRGQMTNYPMSYSSNSITSSMYNSFAGLKSEFFIRNNKFGFAGGLRYTRSNGWIGKYYGGENGANFFYLLYRQDGINTEYLKIKEINQASDCIGIPLEVRFFPYKPRLFRLYMKIGAEINFRLKTHTDVVFYDIAMEQFQNDVSEIVGQPANFSSSIYGAVGLRIGHPAKPSVSIEMCAPAVYMTPSSGAMLDPTVGHRFSIKCANSP